MQNHDNICLSIITVTFNAEKTLPKTFESIFSQNFCKYELIVIDGGSTDQTTKIIDANKNRISYYVCEPDNGIYDAMNKGMRVAKGKYITFLNAGDVYSCNNVLENVFSKENILDKPDLIYGDINIVSIDGHISPHKAKSFTLDNLQRYGTGVLCHQAMFVKRSIAPLYNCKYRFKAELNWYFDIAESDKISYLHIDQTIVNYSMGGFGHKYFLRNRLEWILLVIRRYGYKTVREKKLIPFLLKNAVFRYPFLQTLMTRIGKSKSKKK